MVDAACPVARAASRAHQSTTEQIVGWRKIKSRSNCQGTLSKQMEKAQREKLVRYDCEVRVWAVREGRELFLSRIASLWEG